MIQGTNPGLVQSALRARAWITAGIVGVVLLVAMIFVLPVNAAADETSVNIGNNEFQTVQAAKQKLEDKGVATVTVDGATMTVTMTQNVTGRISFRIPDVRINFDANRKTLNAGGQNEPLCFNHVDSKSTATVTGFGTFYGGSNWAVYAGNNQTVTIENGNFTRGLYGKFGGEGKIIPPGAVCQHNYKMIQESKFIRERGKDCQTPDTYWYACAICGQSAENDDSVAADKKSYTGMTCGSHQLSDWQHVTNTDGKQIHYKECTVTGCDYKDAEGDCSGGKATCQKKAVCGTCGAEYGELGAHNYVWVITDETHWMQCQTEGCKDTQKLGGHFDQNKDGKCDYCTYEMKLTPAPENPADPKNPDAVKTAPAAAKTAAEPKTGDDSFAAPLLALLFLSGSLGALCIANRKKENI